MTQKHDTTQLEIQLEQARKHKAWVIGWEHGNGNKAPYLHNLSLLIGRVEDALYYIKTIDTPE